MLLSFTIKRLEDKVSSYRLLLLLLSEEAAPSLSLCCSASEISSGYWLTSSESANSKQPASIHTHMLVLEALTGTFARMEELPSEVSHQQK